MAGVAAGAVTLASATSRGIAQSPPDTGFVFRGVTIQYDAAGNRVFRSQIPAIEINPELPFYEDSSMFVPGPNQGGDDTGPIDTLITP